MIRVEHYHYFPGQAGLDLSAIARSIEHISKSLIYVRLHMDNINDKLDELLASEATEKEAIAALGSGILSLVAANTTLIAKITELLAADTVTPATQAKVDAALQASKDNTASVLADIAALTPATPAPPESPPGDVPPVADMSAPPDVAPPADTPPPPAPDTPTP